ncbi:MAG: F0F1 ATP synthase subunit A [Acidobacteria bacterium]|nr:F0F1 ATP synthase subunit A [Acidobacteriota bacterium]
MAEHETWLTALFNDHLAGVGQAALALVGAHTEDPARPWANFITMQFVVAGVMIVLFALIRPRLSVDRPGKLQHIFEVFHGFFQDQIEDVGVHHGYKYLAFFGSLFFFILFCNLLGLIPTFESPTMFAPVPLGCALATFAYFNIAGMREHGVLKYTAHFGGPVWWLAPIMFPIEIISTLARPLSLTIRLYANMYAGEQVTLAFLSMVPLGIPVVFFGLHVFVSFLQAYIFMLLTIVYVSGAVAHEH